MIITCKFLKVNKKFYTKRYSQDGIIIFRKKFQVKDMNNVLSIEKLGMSNVSHFRLYNTGKLFIINLIIDKEVVIITKSCKNSFTASLKCPM